jgi:hypothetical protein
MKDFISKHPEMISKILEVEGFNREKLEKIIEITSNKKIKFEFAGACPYSFWMDVNLGKRINDLDYFIRFLKENDLYKEDYRMSSSSFSYCDYRVFIDQGKPSELEIRFHNPKQ